MVKLSELANVEISPTQILLGIIVGAVADHYYLTKYRPRELEKKALERRQYALEFATTAAPIIAAEMEKVRKMPQAEGYYVTNKDELAQLIDEIMEAKMKKYMKRE
jgi:hypothetical protein